MIPHNDDIEKMMIGLALLNGRIPWEARALSVTDFYSGLHRRLWQIILELDEDNEPLEIATVHDRLKIDSVRLSQLSQMAIGLPVQLSITREVGILKRLSGLRSLQKGLSEVVDRIERKSDDINGILDDIESLVDTIRQEKNTRGGTSMPLGDVITDEVFPRLDRFVSGELVKVPFGWSSLDRATNGGVAMGELVVFGASPKSGKSGLLLQIARQQAERGIGCYLCSREMLNYENALRVITQTSRFTANHMRPDLRPETAESIKAHASSLRMPLHFDDKAKSVADIRKEVLRLDASGQKVTSIFVDYVQLMQGKGDAQNRADMLEGIIYGLKDLALEREKAVFCNAQFNRDGIDAVRPRMSDFKGTSAIEMAGNLVLLWTLDQNTDPEGARPGKLWIEAGRNVAYDEFDLRFHGSRAFFEVL